MTLLPIVIIYTINMKMKTRLMGDLCKFTGNRYLCIYGEKNTISHAETMNECDDIGLKEINVIHTAHILRFYISRMQ